MNRNETHLFPIVQRFGSYTWYPKEFFGVVELITGLMLGLWFPLMQRARNHDCFSMMWNLVLELYKWHTLADDKNQNKFKGFWDYISFILVPTITSVRIWQTSHACADQWDVNEKIPWLAKFRTKGTYDLENLMHNKNKPRKPIIKPVIEKNEDY